jgi:hypothetical protein
LASNTSLPGLQNSPSRFTFNLVIVFATLLVTLLFVDPKNIYLSLRKLHLKFEKLTGTKLHWAIMALIVILPGIDLIAKFAHLNGNFGFIFLIGLFGMGIFRGVKELRQQLKIIKNQALDPILIIERANRELFAFSLIPMIVARVFSILGLIYLIETSGSYLGIIGFMSCSALALMVFEPLKKHYMAPCPSCFLLTTVVVAEFNCCPACKRDRFQKQVLEKLSDATEASAKKSLETPQESRFYRYQKALLNFVNLTMTTIKEKNTNNQFPTSKAETKDASRKHKLLFQLQRLGSIQRNKSPK